MPERFRHIRPEEINREHGILRGGRERIEKSNQKYIEQRSLSFAELESSDLSEEELSDVYQQKVTSLVYGLHDFRNKNNVEQILALQNTYGMSYGRRLEQKKLLPVLNGAFRINSNGDAQKYHEILVALNLQGAAKYSVLMRVLESSGDAKYLAPEFFSDTEAVNISQINNAQNVFYLAKRVRQSETAQPGESNEKDQIERELAEPSQREFLENWLPLGMSFEDLVALPVREELYERVCQAMVGLNGLSYKEHLLPILQSQGDSAFMYLTAIRETLWTKSNPENLADFAVSLSRRYTTRAREIMENLVNRLDDPAAEIPQISEYVEKIGVAHFDIYNRYASARTPTERENVRERIELIQTSIYKGEVAADMQKDPSYAAIVFSVFRPALGVTQEQYDHIISRREDLQKDVPLELDPLQYYAADIQTGDFTLGEGVRLDLQYWDLVNAAVKEVGSNPSGSQIDLADIGEKIVSFWRQVNPSAADQKTILALLYRQHLATGGGALPEEYSIDAQGLSVYYEFVVDSIKNDLVREALSAWKETQPQEYEKLRTEIENRTRGTKTRIYNQFLSRRRDIQMKSGTERDGAIASMENFLQPLGLSFRDTEQYDNERIRALLEAVPVELADESMAGEMYRTEDFYNSPEFLEAYKRFEIKHDTNERLQQKMANDLVGKIGRSMQVEIAKFTFISSAEEQKKRIEFVVSKKREHSVAGLNMGVCVAPDERLWKDPTFMNCIIFEPESKRALGGMHFLIRENSLCIPGINPSVDLISETDSERLLDVCLDYAHQTAQALGLDRVLIPVERGIHSNRDSIHAEIVKKSFATHRFNEPQQFSYSPHAYSFQECYVA